jgi:Nucleotide-diphospho-sugar transferase
MKFRLQLRIPEITILLIFTTMKRGIIYLASGGRSYLGELLTSFKSLRRWEPTLPVTVFSKFALPPGMAHCDSQPITSLENPFKIKVLTLAQSPYEETLFLDTDTTVRRPLGPIFDQLGGHDFAAANSHEADWSVKPAKFMHLVKPGDYNTGVLLYRKSESMLRFLKKWEDAVMAQDSTDMWAGHNCDQFYFNKLVKEGSLTQNGVAFRELDNVECNARGCMLPEIKRTGRIGDIRILHQRTRAMKARKLLYSVTDWAAIREIGIKAVQRVKPPTRSF